MEYLYFSPRKKKNQVKLNKCCFVHLEGWSLFSPRKQECMSPVVKQVGKVNLFWFQRSHHLIWYGSKQRITAFKTCIGGLMRESCNSSPPLCTAEQQWAVTSARARIFPSTWKDKRENREEGKTEQKKAMREVEGQTEHLRKGKRKRDHTQGGKRRRETHGDSKSTLERDEGGTMQMSWGGEAQGRERRQPASQEMKNSW